MCHSVVQAKNQAALHRQQEAGSDEEAPGQEQQSHSVQDLDTHEQRVADSLQGPGQGPPIVPVASPFDGKSIRVI